MADVFISYKAEEFDDANWVRTTLETNGISCWMAPMCIPGGSNYAVEIPQAIREAKVFVLILSEKSQLSKWVPRELDQAINESKTILPFMLENCQLKDDFNFYLSNVQRYAAYENKSLAIQKMIKQIQAILGTTEKNDSKSLTSKPESIQQKTEKKDEEVGPKPSKAKKTKNTIRQQKPVKNKKEKNKSNKPLFAIIGTAAVFAVVVMSIVFIIKGHSVVIAGEKFYKSDSYISLEGKELSAEDLSKLSEFKKLNSIHIADCVIPSDGLYKIFKTVTYRVELIRCGITNDMLSEIDFNDITVDIIRLDGNDKLSDLKPLSDLGENLQELSFNDCSVSDVSFIANLTSLQKLAFDGNGVKEISSLSNCKMLEEISVRSNELINLRGLEQCISLKKLYANSNRILNIEGIQNATLITEVDLSNNHISDIAILAKSKDNLRKIDISNNWIKDIDALSDCVSLTELSVSNNKVESLVALSDMINLTTLNAAGNRINNITSISNCKKLTSIDLSNNLIVDPL